MSFNSKPSKRGKEIMTLLFMNYFTRKALKINHDKTRKQFHMGNRGLSLKRDQPYRTLRI